MFCRQNAVLVRTTRTFWRHKCVTSTRRAHDLVAAHGYALQAGAELRRHHHSGVANQRPPLLLRRTRKSRTLELLAFDG